MPPRSSAKVQSNDTQRHIAKMGPSRYAPSNCSLLTLHGCDLRSAESAVSLLQIALRIRDKDPRQVARQWMNVTGK